jgi:ubiquinone/menaquinone biosynthesis C-methylase UbiE
MTRSHNSSRPAGQHGAILALLIAAWCMIANPVAAQRTQPARPASPTPKTIEADEDIPAPLTHYKNREIAQTMHFTGAPWLVRDEREREERASEMIKALGVKPGQVVCDLGCGNGYHALMLSELVGKKGQIIGVDIQREMLLLLEARAKEAKVDNIKTVLSLPHDPKLDENSVDLILLVDVYHEFSHPEHMLRSMRRALKKDGRIALVEFREEDPRVPIKPEHKMSKKQILSEFPPNGFKLAEEYDKLPWQHLMFFTRDDAEKKAKPSP